MPSQLPINLENLLRQRQVEGERIEYKAGWNPDTILRTLCAFANDFENLGGGYVVIGQDCDAQGRPVFPPVGLAENQLDRIQRELLAFCNLIQPPYFPLLSVERYEGKNLLVLSAPGGLTRPYKVPRSVVSKTKEYHYYIRRYASTVEAKNEEERELISLTAQVPFDDRVNQSATLKDLSPRLMEEFLREVGSELANEVPTLSVEALGRQMKVVSGPKEAPLPHNVGLLFFNEHPERFFPVTQIDVVWFPEGAGGDRFEEKVFQGPLGRITRDAINYIQRNYLKETVLKHPQRAEAERFWNFPHAAIEEAVVNAVFHRSYEIREPVEIRITRQDLVVLSFPGPDRSIKMEDLRKGKAVSRRYRNRRIGEFLKELALTEGRSTGISKIIKSMSANGSPTPEFETDEDRTHFLIRLPIHEKAEDKPDLGRNGSGQITNGSGQSSGQTVMSSGQIQRDTPEKVVQLIRQHPHITAGEMAMKLGVSTRSVEKNLAKLKDLGKVRHSGANKSGRWEVAESELENPAQPHLATPQVTSQDTPQDTQQVTPQDTQQVTPQDTPQVTPQDTPQVTPQVESFLAQIQGEMSRNDMMSQMGIKDRKHFAKTLILPALEGKLLEMTLPDKPSSKKQRYRLTEAGKRFVTSRKLTP